MGVEVLAQADNPAPVSTRGPIAPGDLADLVASFSEVTARLSATHDHLRAEVARLTSELGQANEQIQRSRRLAALGEMAAGIAHEVRNPLGSIRLYARLLDQDLADRPAERSTVAKIGQAAKALDGIVGDVLTFAREFKIRHEPTPASELLDRAAESCSHDGVPGWGEAALVRADLLRPDTDRPVLYVDPGLAVQALVNVVRNAFEAVGEVVGQGKSGGHAVTLDAFEIENPDADGRPCRLAVISVRDTGAGVTDDVVQRMFNPFFTTRSAGTGLGLPIVHRIVDAHGGRVVVRNNASQGRPPGDPDPRGATVELVFPVPSADPVRPAGPEPGNTRASVVVTTPSAPYTRPVLEQIR